jgi:hypothetical protein
MTLDQVEPVGEAAVRVVDRGATLDRRLAFRADPSVPVEVERVELG